MFFEVWSVEVYCMDVVFSVCIVTRGAVSLCVSCGSSQCCVLNLFYCLLDLSCGECYVISL